MNTAELHSNIGHASLDINVIDWRMALLQAREQPWLDALAAEGTDQTAVALTAERERALELSK